MEKVHIQCLNGKDWLGPTHFLRTYAFTASPPLFSKEADEKKWHALFGLGEGYFLADEEKTACLCVRHPFSTKHPGETPPHERSGIGGSSSGSASKRLCEASDGKLAPGSQKSWRSGLHAFSVPGIFLRTAGLCQFSLPPKPVLRKSPARSAAENGDYGKFVAVFDEGGL